MVNSTVSLRMLDNNLSNLNLLINSLFKQIEDIDTYLEVKLIELKFRIYDLKKELTLFRTYNENVKELIKIEIEKIADEFDYWNEVWYLNPTYK